MAGHYALRRQLRRLGRRDVHRLAIDGRAAIVQELHCDVADGLAVVEQTQSPVVGKFSKRDGLDSL